MEEPRRQAGTERGDEADQSPAARHRYAKSVPCRARRGACTFPNCVKCGHLVLTLRLVTMPSATQCDVRDDEGVEMRVHHLHQRAPLNASGFNRSSPRAAMWDWVLT